MGRAAMAASGAVWRTAGPHTGCAPPPRTGEVSQTRWLRSYFF